MSEVTRDPRSSTATATSHATLTGALSIGLPMLFPDIPAEAVGIILGAVVMASGALGHLARDWSHECESQDPPEKASFLVRTLGNYLG